MLIVLALIASIILSLFVALRFASAQNNITIYVYPRGITVDVCQEFTVSIMIDNPEFVSIGDYDFFLNYDSTQMTPVSASDGGYLKPTVTFNWETLNNTVHVWAYSNDPAGQNEPVGTLATVTFHCIAEGGSALFLEAQLSDPVGGIIIPDFVLDGNVTQVKPTYWEPTTLQEIVEWPRFAYEYALVGLPTAPEPYNPSTPAAIITPELEAKGFTFNDGDATYEEVTIFMETEEFKGGVMSWWSNNTLEDGTRACIVSAAMEDNTSIAMGFVTNLLPPEQIPGVDPYIIYNAEPYFFIDFYWWAWDPVGKIVRWSYWWHDSHHHPNWFWGPYWWWRCYTKAYFLGIPWPPTDINWAYWRPWWGWWWHWVYWRHWHWWSTYFPYGP